MEGMYMSRQTVQANEIKSTGPTWDRWPANLPYVAYVTADGGFLCVTCANGGNGSRAAEKNLDRDADMEWYVIGAQTLENFPIDDQVCAHCDRAIPLAPQYVTLGHVSQGQEAS
jgi:hypothetical protein